MKKIILAGVSLTAILSANIAFAYYCPNCANPNSNTDMSLSDYQSSAYYQNEQNKKFEADSKVGFTIGLNAGYATVRNHTRYLLPAGTFRYSNNSGFAWNANLGYQFSRYFAIETGYTQFPDMTETRTFLGVTSSSKNTFYGFDLLLKGILPVTNNFNLFAKAGAMYFSAQHTLLYSKSYYEIDPEAGLGVSYDITQHVAIAVQGVGIFGNNYTTYAGYGGLIFKFN
jgi:opacity protein-like surface antigen